MRWLIIFLLVVFVLSFVKADSISVDPIGDNIVISPNPYIQTGGSSPFGCIPLTCSGTGANCDSWQDGCGGIINCGVCSSGYYCSSGICTLSGTGTPPPGGGITPPVSNVTNITLVPEMVIIPAQINLKMAINTSSKQIIRITNNGNTTQTLTISQNNLSDMIIIRNASLTLVPGETRNLEVVFVASEIGVFIGEILVGKYKVLVNLDVKEKNLLFDLNIMVLNRDYKISQGKPLKTKISLIPMGDKERLDVTLDYVVKDYNGNVYLTKSETILVEDKIDFYRNFETGVLPIGKYIIELKFVYPGGTALSSAHFEVLQTTAQDFLGFVMFTLITAMIIVSIVIIALSIRVKMRKKIE